MKSVPSGCRQLSCTATAPLPRGATRPSVLPLPQMTSKWNAPNTSATTPWRASTAWARTQGDSDS
eukprot:9122885-Pyramimonas_sp.AAC.1